MFATVGRAGLRGLLVRKAAPLRPFRTPGILRDSAPVAAAAAANGQQSGGSGSTGPKPKPSRFWRYTKIASALGVGWLSLYLLDALANDDLDLVLDKFRSKHPEEERKNRPHVVILGAGWAALNMLRKLHTDGFRVTIISPRNYFLFTPLLPSTTTGTLQHRSIVEPIRAFCKRSDASEANFVEAECTAVDVKNNTVKCFDNSAVKGDVNEFELKYDHLVVAVGAESATFGIPGVQENAIFLKEIKHSIDIRDRVLDSLETANIPGQTESEIQRLLHFVVVGGGPSGIEYAAELHDFLVHDMVSNYPEIANKVRITVVEALPHILTMFDAHLINHTEKIFKDKLHINLLLNSPVASVGPKALMIKKKDGPPEEMPYGVLVWVTGNATKSLVKQISSQVSPDIQNDRRGLVVDKYMRVKGTQNVWALGDCAISGYPPTAQVASQEGRFLGKLLNSLEYEFKDLYQQKISTEEFAKKVENLPSFKYKHFGSFAYIGDMEAIAQINYEDKNHISSSGLVTFFLWRSVYFSKLLSYKNRFLVITDWMKTAIFGRDVSRA